METHYMNIGMVVPEWKNYYDGLVVEYNDYSGLAVYAFMQSPRKSEIDDFRAHSRLSVYFTSVDGLGWFTFRFGSTTADAPFSPNIYTDKPKCEMIADQDLGLAMNAFLIDTAKGKLVGIRSVGLSHEISNQFLGWCRESLKHPLSKAQYDQKVQSVLRRYSTEELMQKHFLSYEANFEA